MDDSESSSESGSDGSGVDNLSDFSDTPSTPAEPSTSDDEFIASDPEDDDGMAVEWYEEDFAVDDVVVDLAEDVEMDMGEDVGMAEEEQPAVEADQVVPNIDMATLELSDEE